MGNLTNLQALDLHSNQLSGSLPSSLVNLTDLEDLWLQGTQLCAPTDADFQAWLEGIDDKYGVVNCEEKTPPSTAIEMSVTPNEISEDSGAIEVTVTATLNGKALEEDAIVRVDINNEASTATRDVDYVPLFTNVIIVIPAGQIAGHMTFFVSPLVDLEAEGDETIQLIGLIDELMGDEVAITLTEINLDPINPDPINPDRAVLEALYEATDGDNWTDNTNWLSDRPLDEWFGVDTDDDGRVTRLQLRENRLLGVLPSELGNLTNLIELWLFDNDLSGVLPSSLSNLTSLQLLYLNNNQFSGALPSWLGNLTKLQWLALDSNQFSGVLPSELGNLTNLQTLWLFNNDLSGVLPSSLVNLTNLEWLWLDDTQLCAPTDAGFQTWLDGIDNKQGVVNCEAPSDPINPDRAVLVALYEATNGDNWKDNTHWLSDRPLSDWFGVTTDANGRVTRLRLSENQLSGSLPSELGSLNNLQWLVLFNNAALSGPLPGSFTRLVNLDLLHLSGTQVCAPTDDAFQTWLAGIGNKSGVENCGGAGSRPIDPLVEFEFVVVVGTPIDPVLFPAVEGGNPPLTYGMSGLPPGLAFDSASRTLSGTPTTAGTYEATYTVTDSAGASVSVSIVIVVKAADSRADPPADPDRAVLVALYNATNGHNWTDNTNWLSDQPLGEWFGVTTDENGRVTRLRLRENQLSGSLPESLGNLTNLQRLHLYDNALSGALPRSLGNLTNLTYLNLGDNALSGALPPSLGNLTNLQQLGLFDNKLSGGVPSSLGNLNNLQELWLKGNDLEGTLPSSLVNLTNLQTLRLEDTQLCAPPDAAFQAWLGGIGTKRGVRDCKDPRDPINPDRAALVALYNSTNGDNWADNTNWLSDRPLGEWYGVGTNANGRVTELWLYDNALSGTLPASLGNLTHLELLELGGNDLSGSILSELGNLTNLRSLGLSSNQLSGPLPTWLGNLTHLEALGLNFNQLSGTLPSSLGNLTKLERLYLGFNQLSGALPSSLGNLTNLQELGLANNQLSGALPSSLGNLTKLEWLSLADTHLCAPLDATFQTWLQGIERKVGVDNCEEPGEPDPINPDRAALVALYNSTNGDNWTNDTNWLSDRPLGEWYGVTTDGDGRVTRLELHENALSGVLPSELGSLANLQTLYLRYNQLSGALPSELGSLANLQTLNLGDNQLSGALPSELGDLTNLTFLNLDFNQLSGVLPSELGDLTNLTFLNLGVNRLSGSLPLSLSNLSNLQVLGLYRNQLSGELPSWLGGLTNLTYLDLGFNQLSGTVPSSLGNLTNLESLYLGFNQLSGSLPSSLGNLTNLQELGLDRNQLSGSLPSSLGNLTKLKWLSLAKTQLCAPTDAAFQRWLEGIETKDGVEYCDGGGPTAIVLSVNPQTIREDAGTVEIAVTATLDGKALDEDATVSLRTSVSSTATRDVDYTAWLEPIVIPAGQIAGQTTITVRVIDDNEPEGDETILLVGEVDGLTGDEIEITIIDDDEATRTNPDRAALVALYNSTNGDNWTNDTNWLSDRPLNEWYGVTTDADGRVTGLTLGGNQLSGALPSSLGNLTNLQTLRLDRNALSGALPSSLDALTNLQWLDLGQNQLSGSIPSELGALTNLQSLDLSFNQLSGSIPSSLGDLTNLQSLVLRSNQLSGSIPSSLGVLTNLQWLGLYGNQLSGSIPSWLGTLTNLQLLELSFNQLSGSIPSGLGALTNLQWLYLYGNQLSGSIPSELGALTNLQELALSDNQLSGSIPRSLGALTNLQSLALHGNQLSGALPSSLVNLTNLQELLLSGNQLSGALPSSLVNLTNLEKLWLYNTQLCVPPDAGFQVWLDGIDDKNGVEYCDDKSRSTAIVLSVNPQTIREDEGEVPIGVTATLDGKALDEDATVRLSGGGGSAVRDVDYGMTLGPIVIPAGQIAGQTTIAVWVIDDDEPEDDETIQLIGEVDRLTGDEVEITIIDDDEATRTNPDRAALVALYNSTNGDNWANDTNWLSDRPLGEWYGVGTNANGRVTGLELGDNALSGSIPSELGNLLHLQELSLDDNALSGALPSSLVNLTNLGELSLQGTQLCAPTDAAFQAWLQGIYTEGVVNCGDPNPDRAALVALYNSTNGDNWTNDTHWLSDRPLGEWYGVTTDGDGRVTELALVDNALSGTLPSALGNLTNLQWLQLQHNQLSGTLPSALGDLTNLQRLSLYDNQLSGSIPSTLGNLTNLRYLWLVHNQLSGSIPSTLGNLTNLEELVLYDNQLSGSIPSTLGNLTNLRTLRLHSNQLSGALPSTLGNLTSLEELNMENTQLCAPTDAAFQRWLDGIDNKQGVVNCEDDHADFRFVEGVEIEPVVFQGVQGGEPPLTYSMSGLPPGLVFDGATRTLSGTPTVAGTYEVVLIVEDSVGQRAESPPIIVIVEPSR